MLAPPPALATVTVGRLGTGPPRTASFFPAHCKVQKKTERKEGPSTAMTLGSQPTAICSGANVSGGVSFFLVVLSYGGGGGVKTVVGPSSETAPIRRSPRGNVKATFGSSEWGCRGCRARKLHLRQYNMFPNYFYIPVPPSPA